MNLFVLHRIIVDFVSNNFFALLVFYMIVNIKYWDVY